MKTGWTILTAFIGGAVLGTTAGLLFAPEKGENQRRKIPKNSAESRTSAKYNFKARSSRRTIAEKENACGKSDGTSL